MVIRALAMVVLCGGLLTGACRDNKGPAAAEGSASRPGALAGTTPRVIAVSFFGVDGARKLTEEWTTLDRRLKRQPGYDKSVLLATAGKAPFLYLNLAVWASASDIERALRSDALGKTLRTRAKTAWYRPALHRGDYRKAIVGGAVFVAPIAIPMREKPQLLEHVELGARFFARQPGFEAFVLLAKVGGDAPYNFVLLARWSSEKALRKATEVTGYDKAIRGLRGAEMPGLYYQLGAKR